MSLMMVSRLSADFFTSSRYSRCLALRSVSRASAVMPITPFMGVRISWLITARNSLLAWLAACAACMASCRAWRLASRSCTTCSTTRDNAAMSML